MNISDINNFINVINYILKCFAHAVAQAADVSVAVTRIYHWRHEVFRDTSLERSEFFIEQLNFIDKFI